jgi:FAD/FMN-containing dehydrogenase
MPERLDRRAFLAGAVAGTTALAGSAIIGFDPLRRGWVTAAAASEGRAAGVVSIPDLDGALLLDPGTLAAAADDYGHIVHRTPVAVLRPGSVRDVTAVVRYANRHRIRVAMRGQGHATSGQAQVDGGVVIDGSTLAGIHRVGGGVAVVDAGVRWLELAQAAAAVGLTAPVFPDYVGLSVGGTLSVGGIGGATQHHGLQVDNVLALDVVTGDGVLRHCSASQDRPLFEAVLGGLGQFGILVGATLRLVPAPTHARNYQLYYADLGSYLADQRLLVADGRFSSVEGQAVPTAAGGWEFFADAAAYYTEPAEPDDAALLAGLRFDPARTVVTDYTYGDWVNRLAPAVALLKELGVWYFPHPWINLFLPDSRTQELVGSVLASLTPDDTGQGPVLLYPFRTGRLTRPFVPVPAEPVAFVFAILRAAVPPDPAVVQRQLQDNRALYEAARAVGGKRYPVGSVPFSPADWRDHYGARYPAFAAAKACYDPLHLLTPGQRIF